MLSKRYLLFILVILSLLLLAGCKEDFQAGNTATSQNITNDSTNDSYTYVKPKLAVTAVKKDNTAPSGQTKESLPKPTQKSMTEPEPEAGEETRPEPEGPFCGDGSCEGSENCDRCYEDCSCESPAECHKGVCKTPECGGDGDCKDDDACTNDICYFAQHVNAYCANEPIKKCRNKDGCCPPGCNAETDTDCPSECGNKVCEPGETSSNCNKDCGPKCGNGICESGERESGCTDDCTPVCGNGICESGEDYLNCDSDCTV